MQRHCGNIGYTRHRTKTNKTEETIKNGQCRDTVATLGTQDTGRRQTKQNMCWTSPYTRERQANPKPQYVFETTLRKQTQIT
jgi:hypothetical protein